MSPFFKKKKTFLLSNLWGYFVAWRRFEAAEWLENLVGPLGVSSEPSEREFISCLRNGLILCNAINKINPGTVTKVLHSLI